MLVGKDEAMIVEDFDKQTESRGPHAAGSLRWSTGHGYTRRAAVSLPW